MIFSLTKEKLAVDTMTVDMTAKVNVFIEAIKNTSKQTGTGPLAVRSEPVDEDKSSGNIEFKDISAQLYNILIKTDSREEKTVHHSYRGFQQYAFSVPG